MRMVIVKLSRVPMSTYSVSYKIVVPKTQQGFGGNEKADGLELVVQQMGEQARATAPMSSTCAYK